MARIKIEIPERPIAEITIPVRITDINYGNHVGNDSMVAIVHESRVQWLKHYNYTELEVEGVGLIMSDLAVEYISESFYGDVLTVVISIGEVSRVGFELYYSLQANRNGQTIMIAKAKTGMVCYDYHLKKIAAVPENLRTLFAAF